MHLLHKQQAHHRAEVAIAALSLAFEPLPEGVIKHNIEAMKAVWCAVFGHQKSC